jgi:lipopolysaccharide transport system permease protein
MAAMNEIVIRPGSLERNYWRDLWAYRELFYILSWRDIKVRYKQTVIGAAWSVVRPLLTMIILTVIFQKVAGLSSEGDAPYPVMVFAGLVAWQFFSSALAESANSLVGNTNLISKVYFPRIIIPASAVITSFVDFLISFVLLLLMMLFYQYPPDWKLIFLPFFTLLVFLTSFGIGLWLTALNVKYRDFRYIIPFIVQFGLYVSPVGVSVDAIPEEWRLLYSLNPMVGIIDGFRWCILGEKALYIPGVLMSIGVTTFFLVLGIWYFRKTERGFADHI